jgi:hypothetical protein
MARQRQLIVLVLVAVLLTAAISFAYHCPVSGIAFTARQLELHRLKNRTTFPSAADFDSRVSLSELLQPGDDHSRWSDSRAATVEGYVVSIAPANPELANCYCGRDIHIHIGLRRDAPPREHFVIEQTPRLSPAGNIGFIEQMRSQLIGRWVRFEGWLFFDEGHAEESENVAPGRQDNWRATAWEIHPVTKVQVIR